MSQSTNVTVTELTASQKKGLVFIADLIQTSILKRDEVLHLSADKMQELVKGVNRKEWEALFKGLKDSLINLCKIGSGTANNYATEISDILQARDVSKPSSDNIKAKQKQARKEALQNKYAHVAKENLIKQLTVETDAKVVSELTKVIADKAKDEAKQEKDANANVANEAKTKWNAFAKALFETEPELCALIIANMDMVREVLKG
jgi:hypothetical protein